MGEKDEPKTVRSSQVPDRVLFGMIGMGLGHQPDDRLWRNLCLYADLHGGDVIVAFDRDDERVPTTKKGWKMRQIRFVSPP